MAQSSRPIASLTISFGLVSIPVQLFSATVPSERISFHLLRKSDGSRVKEQYIAVNDGKLVNRSDMVKGYEFAKGKHVMFTPNELKALEDTSSAVLDIVHFVPLDSVDPVYFSATYYLLPNEGGAKPYALFSTALREEGRCAVGKWTSRGKEHVVIIRAIGNRLALHQLHFKAELRKPEDFGRDTTKVSEAEVKLARQLIDQLTADRFDPEEFVDQHRARVQAEIKKKINGKDITLEEPQIEKRSDNVINLMDALRASLQGGGRAGKARRTPSRSRSKRGRRAA
jgi:DNA end-binding protein Ku